MQKEIEAYEQVAILGFCDQHDGYDDEAGCHHFLQKNEGKVMVCKECGKENKDDAKYCVGCGAILKREHHKKGDFYVTIGILAVVIVVGGYSEKSCFYW